jgi:hypothetical protein
MYVQEPVCQICRWGIPYADLAEAIKARGFEHGDLIAYDDDLAGNLLRFFPNARIGAVGPRQYLPPEQRYTQGGGTVLVWEAKEPAGRVSSAFNAILGTGTAEVMAKAETVQIPWRGHLWKPDGYRFSEWRLTVIKPR